MKRIFFIIIVIIHYSIVAQTPTNSHQPEIYMFVTNFDVSNMFLEKIGNAYCVTTSFYSCNDCSGGSAVTSLSGTGKAGWGLCNVGQSDFNLYGWGIYIIYAKGTTHYIYLDIRDTQYHWLLPYPYLDADFYIKFEFYGNGDGSYFKWKPYANNSSWINCPDGSVIQIWKGRNLATPNVEAFPVDFFENSISVAPITPDGGTTVFYDSPVIIWGKEQESNITKYRVYRAINNSLTPPSLSNFTWIKETNQNELNFKDVAILKNGNTNTDYVVHYYVKSYAGNTAKNSTLIKTLPVSQNEYYYSIEVDWSNVLMKTEENGHPRIVWAPLTTGQTVNKYKIYKNGVLFHVINSGTVYAYTDYSEWLYTQGNQKGYVNYKVKAYYNSTARTGYSNVVSYAINDAANKINLAANSNNLDYHLFQNYPNPTNPSTVINYTIPRASYVTLKVYNSLGKEVAALVNGNKEAGKHAVTFDGSGLPSGVYFYTLTAGEFTDTKKLILMK
jgi:hypothetical protein